MDLTAPVQRCHCALISSLTLRIRCGTKVQPLRSWKILGHLSKEGVVPWCPGWNTPLWPYLIWPPNHPLYLINEFAPTPSPPLLLCVESTGTEWLLLHHSSGCYTVEGVELAHQWMIYIYAALICVHCWDWNDGQSGISFNLSYQPPSPGFTPFIRPVLITVTPWGFALNTTNGYLSLYLRFIFLTSPEAALLFCTA